MLGILENDPMKAPKKKKKEPKFRGKIKKQWRTTCSNTIAIALPLTSLKAQPEVMLWACQVLMVISGMVVSK
jgi:hypothetical protein